MTTTTTAPVAVSEHAPTRSTPAADPERVDLGSVRVVHTRHWFRWTLSAILIFAIAQFVWSLFTNANYEWDVFARVLLLRARADRNRLHAGAHRDLGEHRLHPRHGARARPAVEVGSAELDLVGLHLVLPVGAARRADHRLVQPRLPLPDAGPRDAVHDRLLDRGVPDGAAHQRVRRRDPRARPAPGGLFRRDHPRRTDLGRPGPAGGGRGPRHPGPQAAVPHHPPAGDAIDHPQRHERGDRPRQGRIGRVRHRDPRAVLRGAGHLQPQQPSHPAAAGRGRLVHGHHHDPEHRAVLHRAVLLARIACARCRRPRCSASAAGPVRSGLAWATTARRHRRSCTASHPCRSVRMPASTRTRRPDEHDHRRLPPRVSSRSTTSTRPTEASKC